MNGPLRRVAMFCALLLVVLMVGANWVQVVTADELRNKPGNRRLLVQEYSRERGPILVAGQPIASSQPTTDELKYLRRYADGPLYAPATGYYSFVYGASGVEQAENPVLAGSDSRLFVNRLADLLSGTQPRGGSVTLTLNPAAQAAAMKGLAGRKGAVVALNPTTGAILALVTSPSYDPNALADHDPTKQRQAWETLTKDPNQPMLDRALSETYPPGSTFKLVTAAAALASGKYTKDTVVPGPANLPLPQTTVGLPTYDGRPCGPNDQTTVDNALRISCNTAFGAIGMALGADALRAQAEKFGFDRSDITVPMRAARSVFPARPNAPQTAQSAIGQFDVRATPLQIAMVAAGIANKGVVMKPYLVQDVRAPDLSVLQAAQPQVLSRAMTPENAQQLTDMMVNVVENGTGSNAKIPGILVAGKTGTAQTLPGVKPHAWFVSFAPADNPQVAVAVVVENGGDAPEVSGNQISAPIANAVMRAVLGK